MSVDNATFVKNVWKYKKRDQKEKTKKYMKYIKISENNI